MNGLTIYTGDCREVLKALPSNSVHCCVTSPPYFSLRDYGMAGQIGLEESPDAFIEQMVRVFREVRRVLRDDGTLWLNLGSSYAGGGGFCESAPSTAVSKSGKYGSKGALKAGGVTVVSDGNEPFALRDDLTPDELAYVLSELAAHFRERSEVSSPDIAVDVDAAVTSLACREEV